MTTSAALRAQTGLPAFDRLRTLLRDRPPLAPLEPVGYAAGHALFEDRSDQRALLTAWLAARIAPRAARPSRVLSIGCGDGSVDVVLAAGLTSAGCPTEYVGLEPHAPSGRAFLSRLAALPGVHPSVLTDSFAAARPVGRFDAVLAVHSLYYVADLPDTLRRARSLLAPGGELLVLHAPEEPLNALVRLLAPGHRQEFSAEVAALMPDPEIVRLDARVDLTGSGDAADDRLLLDFTVQAQVPPELRGAVLDALAERALPGPGLVIPHPVDALVAGD